LQVGVCGLPGCSERHSRSGNRLFGRMTEHSH
jgi:hypothetical protein